MKSRNHNETPIKIVFFCNIKKFIYFSCAIKCAFFNKGKQGKLVKTKTSSFKKFFGCPFFRWK